MTEDEHPLVGMRAIDDLFGDELEALDRMQFACISDDSTEFIAAQRLCYAIRAKRNRMLNQGIYRLPAIIEEEAGAESIQRIMSRHGALYDSIIALLPKVDGTLEEEVRSIQEGPTTGKEERDELLIAIQRAIRSLWGTREQFASLRTKWERMLASHGVSSDECLPDLPGSPFSPEVPDPIGGTLTEEPVKRVPPSRSACRSEYLATWNVKGTCEERRLAVLRLLVASSDPVKGESIALRLAVYWDEGVSSNARIQAVRSDCRRMRAVVNSQRGKTGYSIKPELVDRVRWALGIEKR